MYLLEFHLQRPFAASNETTYFDQAANAEARLVQYRVIIKEKVPLPLSTVGIVWTRLDTSIFIGGSSRVFVMLSHPFLSSQKNNNLRPVC